MYRLLVGILALSGVPGAIAEKTGATGSVGESGYQRCAACHLPTGEGIPGAFPPLQGRVASIAASEPGRAYLVAVVNAGLMGSITVDGIPYMGVMPAQGSSYDSQGISDMLNYTVQVIDKANTSADWTPYSAQEVTALIKANNSPTSQGSAKLRQALLEQYPELK
jgi:mono/diheme cytochrome c family protein